MEIERSTTAKFCIDQLSATTWVIQMWHHSVPRSFIPQCIILEQCIVCTEWSDGGSKLDVHTAGYA